MNYSIDHARLGLAALLLAIPLGLAGCASDEPAPPQTFAPLSYGYLRPLRLNVGAIQIDTADVQPAGPADLSAQSPAVPLDALAAMARDRLVASGASGRAVFSVQQASINAGRGTLDGLLKVRLDIFTSDGRQSAFAEAAVARSTSRPDDDDALRPALYALTQQMMSDMNVEFEFQLRRSLGDWLQRSEGPAPPPAAVQQQPLPPPTATPGFRLVPSMPPGA